MTPEEMEDLLDEVGAGLGCTPYLDGGAIGRAEAALSKLRPALAQAHAEGLEAAARLFDRDAEAVETKVKEYISDDLRLLAKATMDNAIWAKATAARIRSLIPAGQPSGDATAKRGDGSVYFDRLVEARTPSGDAKGK